MVHYLRTQPTWPLGQFLIHWSYQYQKNKPFGVYRRLFRTIGAHKMLVRQRMLHPPETDGFFSLRRTIRSVKSLLTEMLLSGSRENRACK
jgi:hypothetical protein